MFARCLLLVMSVLLTVSQTSAKSQIDDLVDRAKKGDPEAQFELGSRYAPNTPGGYQILPKGDESMSDGSRVQTNFQSAVDWLRRAADRDYAPAQFALGLILYQGDGSLEDRTDEIESARWLRKYLENSHANKVDAVKAQFMIGMEYQFFNKCDPYWTRSRPGDPISFDGLYCGDAREGKHLTEDYPASAQYLRLAAKAGDQAAQYQLARLYQDGKGVPQDYQEAAKWYLSAIGSGFSRARGPLGKLYVEMRDLVSAHMWFNLAALTDDRWAAEERDNIAQKMTPAQIAEAQKLAREWTETNAR
ncbi:tetratricopeptide repeat protein [Bradyrhizobium sp. 1]|uniref:tetratricopeptide repeat protein n=1 Tax=Bradyrhizobium sp. 1 TaxID=241591 RepID=UPI001FFBA2BA|nr:tetratricopeptide repeat protein [Bradyrhizobium sp. 1]MCK1394316.1 sel1 repeat family protein [Bradyrhizobium sp. 1]